jgi:hypothetical protein
LWLKKVQFSASTFVVKIATFAKPQNVMCYYENPQPAQAFLRFSWSALKQSGLQPWAKSPI